MRPKSVRLLSLISFLMLFPAAVSSDENDQKEVKPAKLFSTSDTLEVKLSAPWKDLVKRDDYKGTYPAEIEFTDDLGNTHKLDLTVERRGITRQAVCKFPPIKLRFEKETVKGSTFRGQKSLKMVTHCNRGSIFIQYYLLEMLAYQMYNLITDFSFRVRPLSISYRDSQRGTEEDPVFAFLIEDDSDMAKRNDQKKLHVGRIKRSQLDSEEASNFALFQYMISNLDWAQMSGPKPGECCHNSKLVGLDPDKDPVYAVPYDFDSSGLVNAKYAAPPDGLRVRNVTQRLYRGFCVFNATMPAARQRFLDHEQDIYDLINNQAQLSTNSKKKSLKFIGQFFAVLKDDDDYQKKIIGKCRK